MNKESISRPRVNRIGSAVAADDAAKWLVHTRSCLCRSFRRGVCCASAPTPRAATGSFAIGSKKLAVALLLSAAMPLYAEVFSISPFGRKGSAGSLSEVLGGSKLWSEAVVVNGERNKMHISLVRDGAADCLVKLRQLFPDGRFHVSAGAILLEIPRDGGGIERIYLVGLGDATGAFPVIQFSMSFPNGLPEDAPIWPDELPLAPGAINIKTFLFPDRKVVYGSFTTLYSPQAAIADMSASLSARGWRNIGGGVFLSDSPLAICLVSASSDAEGVTRAFVLQRPISN
ncbi:MAG: hypothetical protein JW808_11095 [Victivallales bacterium]|nr:hypothetical protein [Victivallales bacterium]